MSISGYEPHGLSPSLIALLLLLKVLSLLQDSDPVLARDVSSSREALWSILTDPDQFRDL